MFWKGFAGGAPAFAKGFELACGLTPALAFAKGFGGAELLWFAKGFVFAGELFKSVLFTKGLG